MRYSLGKVSYINTLPLFCGGDFADFRIFSATPAELNAKVARAEPDAAMISRWVYEDSAYKNYDVVGRYGIFGDGEIMSVKIFSKVPFADFAKASLFVTSETGTSSRAFAMLFKRKYGVDIFANPRAPIERADAALLIGDAALAFKPYEYCLDLGSMWKAEIGLPMMYSIFVVRKNLREEIELLLKKHLVKSLETFESDRAAIAKKAEAIMENAGRKCPLPTLEKYYECLKYELPDSTFTKTFNFIAANARA